jgi:hypothetical protein
MNGQLYLYDITYILEDGRLLERYGLLAADDMPSALTKLAQHYSNLNTVGIVQLNSGPHEIGEETWADLSDTF